MKIAKEILFIAKEDKNKELKELLITMIEPSRTEDGCLKYELISYKDDEDFFKLIEVWENQEFLNNHKLTKHFENFKSKIDDLIIEKESSEIEII